MNGSSTFRNTSSISGSCLNSVNLFTHTYILGILYHIALPTIPFGVKSNIYFLLSHCLYIYFNRRYKKWIHQESTFKYANYFFFDFNLSFHCSLSYTLMFILSATIFC